MSQSLSNTTRNNRTEGGGGEGKRRPKNSLLQPPSSPPTVFSRERRGFFFRNLAVFQVVVLEAPEEIVQLMPFSFSPPRSILCSLLSSPPSSPHPVRMLPPRLREEEGDPNIELCFMSARGGGGGGTGERKLVIKGRALSLSLERGEERKKEPLAVGGILSLSLSPSVCKATDPPTRAPRSPVSVPPSLLLLLPLQT